MSETNPFGWLAHNGLYATVSTDNKPYTVGVVLRFPKTSRKKDVERHFYAFCRFSNIKPPSGMVSALMDYLNALPVQQRHQRAHPHPEPFLSNRYLNILPGVESETRVGWVSNAVSGETSLREMSFQAAIYFPLGTEAHLFSDLVIKTILWAREADLSMPDGVLS